MRAKASCARVLVVTVMASLIASKVCAGRPDSAESARDKTVFVVPLANDACWQDFAFLAAVPAGSKANGGSPAVVAVDQYGTLRPELRDYLRRYDPDELYMLDCLAVANPTEKGLTGHWALDDGKGTECRDATGRTNGAFQRAAVWKHLAAGPYRFDGRTVAVNDGRMPGSARAITVAFWMNPAAVDNQTVIGKFVNADREPGWQVMLRRKEEGNALRFRVGGGDSAWNQSDVVLENAYTPGEWVHVACSYANGTSRIYLNGSLLATRDNITWSGTHNDQAPLLVGAGFSGILDDVRIYHRELSFVEIQNLPGADSATSEGLAGYWPLDETEGGVARDMIKANDLTAMGAPAWEKGSISGGMRFNRNGDGLRLGREDGIVRPFGVLFNFRSASAQDACILRKPAVSDQIPPWSFHLSGSDLTFRIGNGKDQFHLLKNAVVPGTDVRVGVSYEDGKVRFFINGRPQGVASLAWHGEPCAEPGAVFKGTIDRVTLFDRALTDEEVRLAAPPATGVIADWEQDSGAMKAGEGPDWKTGRQLGALHLNGINEYVDCGVPVSSTEVLTVTCWVNPESPGCLFSCLPYDGPGAGLAVMLESERNGVKVLLGDPSESAPRAVGTHTDAYTPGNWVHMAISIGDKDVTLYLDGQKNMTWMRGKGGIQNAASSLLLGCLHPGNAQLKGAIDDVRVYDRVLSEEEVLAIFATKPEFDEFPAYARLPAQSADHSAATLAGTFWSSSPRVVCCRDADYSSALVASALAARLQVPLLYLGEGGFSDPSRRVLKDLETTSLLMVGTGPVPSLDGLEVTALPDAETVLEWMQANGLEVQYLAAANPQDRHLGRVRKTSLAAPLLAAGRNGAVALLDFSTQWKVPFNASDTAKEKPVADAPDSVAGWKPGQLTINGQTRSFVLTGQGGKTFNRMTLLDAGGKAEGSVRTADRIAMGDRDYTVSLDPASGTGKADVWLTWPGTPEICNRLGTYFRVMGKHPEYLCLLGEPDVIPFALISKNPDDPEDLCSDQPFANTDDDPFLEIGHGRIVAEDVYSGTLVAARGLVYDDLATDGWESRFATAGWPSLIGNEFESFGFTAVPHHSGKDGTITGESPSCQTAAIVHGAHSWWLGLGGLVSWDSRALLAPAIIESSGCSIMCVDKDSMGRSVPERLLRNGAVCVAGNYRNGVAQQHLYRSEFWNAIFMNMTLGQAHRYALNRALLGALEKGQTASGGDRYEFYIRMMYGDPALRMRLPGKSTTRAARFERNRDEVSVYQPERWWTKATAPSQEWKCPHPILHYSRGRGVGTEKWWYNDEHYDRAAHFFAVELRTAEKFAGIEQLDSVEKPLGWSGRHWVDEHQDGTRSYLWRVRMIDVDIPSGRTGSSIDAFRYRLLHEGNPHESHHKGIVKMKNASQM